MTDNGQLAAGDAMYKFGFKIRTRSGSVVENLQVHARDRAEAEHKINQIYRYCEILECHEVTPTLRKEGLDVEDVVALINKQKE
ncbi:MAG: hypothetical protein ACRET6_03790 [Burkholderiales bacterium]